MFNRTGSKPITRRWRSASHGRDAETGCQVVSCVIPLALFGAPLLIALFGIGGMFHPRQPMVLTIDDDQAEDGLNVVNGA